MSSSTPTFIQNLSACFSSLSEQDMDYLNQHKTQVSYHKGETLMKQTAFAPHVLFVNKGYVVCSLELPSQKHINLHLAQQGEYVGFTALFSDTYRYSAFALSEVCICMIEKQALQAILQRNPQFSWQISARNWQQEKRYLDVITTISYKQMRGKLASALLYIQACAKGNDTLFSLFSRQQLADFAAITVESTVRLLKEFEKEGIIRLQQKDIQLIDRSLLLQISQYG